LIAMNSVHGAVAVVQGVVAPGAVAVCRAARIDTEQSMPVTRRRVWRMSGF
jgi:hypothetical protein